MAIHSSVTCELQSQMIVVCYLRNHLDTGLQEEAQSSTALTSSLIKNTYSRQPSTQAKPTQAHNFRRHQSWLTFKKTYITITTKTNDYRNKPLQANKRKKQCSDKPHTKDSCSFLLLLSLHTIRHPYTIALAHVNNFLLHK